MLKVKQSFSRNCFLLSCLLILVIAFGYYSKWLKPNQEATLTWDVMGYYLYLPAIFIYHDLHQLAFTNDIIEKYNPSGSFYQGVLLPNGNYTMKYSVGASIYYAPAFFIGHIFALTFNFPADGSSLPYQAAISWGCLLYAFLGIYFLRKILLQWFSDFTTGITILLLVLGTNYLNYASVDYAMTHNLLFTSYALLIWLTLKWVKLPTAKTAICIGLLVGLMTITRPTELICIAIPLLWGVSSFEALKLRMHFFKLHLGKIAFALIGFMMVCSIQVVYWKITTGLWMYYSYGDQEFSWLHPHFINGLVSYRKGWFIYTPLMVLVIPGFYFLYKNYRTLFWPIFLFSCINAYVVFAWDIWWYGGSLGQRAMVQGYVLLCWPLASLVEAIAKHGTIVKVCTIGFSVFCIWLNCMFTWQAHAANGIYEAEYMTKAYFWKIFGQVNYNTNDKKLLDTDEEFVGEPRNLQLLYQNDFESEKNTTHCSQFSLVGNGSLCINQHHQKEMISLAKNAAPTQLWLRLSMPIFAPVKEWDSGKMAVVKVHFINDSIVIKSNQIKLYRLINEGTTTQVFFDVKIPNQKYTILEIEFDHMGGTKELYIEALKIESFQ